MATFVSPIQQLVVTAGAYAALDGVGAKGSFTSVPRSGVIMGCTLYDGAKQVASPLYVNLFNADFTGVTDNAAWNITSADRTKLVGGIHILAADYRTATDNAYATVDNIGLPYYAPAGILYFQLSTPVASTPTYAATTDLSIGISIVY